MAKYIFTASNGLLVVKLKNIATEFTANESLSFKSPSVQLYGDKILIYDFGIRQKDFGIIDFETINSVVPTTITNAYDLLVALIPSASTPTLINNTTPVSLSGINYVFSTVNSSSVQLAAGDTFLGGIEDTKSQPSISLLMVSDQNMLITVNQFIDIAGTKAAPPIPFTVYAGQQLARSFPINGNYVRITAKNIGASTTTTFQIDTAYGTIDASDGTGNIPVTQASQFASGDITTQNLNANGAATASSAVEVLLNGASTLAIQTTGPYSGALSVQVTNDNVRWETITSALLYNVITGGFSSTIGSSTIGLFSFKTGSFFKARLTALGAQTGTCVVTLRANNSGSIVALDSGLPFGTNTIGNIGSISNAFPSQTAGVGFALQTSNVNDLNGVLTATTTSATVTQGNVQSASFNVVVTAVSGTAPTLDISIEESDDSGTNWYPIFQMARITANGSYRTPVIRLSGNRIRYVQTVGGTTPSFTRAVNRTNMMIDGNNLKVLVDRTVNPNTLNSTTPSYFVGGCDTVGLYINLGAVTTAPVFTAEGSEDNVNFYALSGSTLTTVANSTVFLALPNSLTKFVRARVSTAGTGATLGYVELKALGR